MATFKRHTTAAAALLTLSTACFATEPDQRAQELALSLSSQAPTVVFKSAADAQAAIQAALAAEVSKAQSHELNSKQQGVK